MKSNRIVKVGIGNTYETLRDVFKNIKHGNVQIELTSDVIDEKDIILPPHLKSVYIRSYEDIQRGFKKKDMTIYCNGVSVTFENIGKLNNDVSIIGTQKKMSNVAIKLKHCFVEYLIGANNVEWVNHLCLEIEESEIYAIAGAFNHDKSFCCKSFEMNMIRSKSETLQGTNIVLDDHGFIKDGQIRLQNSIVKDIKLINGKYNDHHRYSMTLLLNNNLQEQSSFI